LVKILCVVEPATDRLAALASGKNEIRTSTHRLIGTLGWDEKELLVDRAAIQSPYLPQLLQNRFALGFDLFLRTISKP